MFNAMLNKIKVNRTANPTFGFHCV